ncbi:hypothetical protein [Neptuniibacter sp. QD48_11]|uniref:hypothetical protein n=1 Tax=Neptuniibacter sp. QD48_11 TaxID=3398211 RepID=UPI0039F545E0
MYIALFVIALFLIGFVSYAIKKNRQDKQIEFATDYRQKFHEYLDSKGEDNAAYGWLIHRSNKMQSQMGSQGVMSNFRPPYANYMVSNYPIILNMIPSLNEAHKDYLLRGQAEQYARAVDEALLRHHGLVTDRSDYLFTKLRNPIAWFQEGVRQVVGSPVYALGMFGIISLSTAGVIVSSVIFRVLSGLVTLIGFASAILTLVIGWDDFFAKLQLFF